MKRLFRSFRKRFSSPRIAATGDHEENLAAHPQMSIPELGVAAGLDVPIWLNVAPDQPTPHTYESLLWEVEPYGEYLYHLAGNFPKNAKGLLRFASATLSAEVHVSFESDSIDVDEQDQAMYAARAMAAACDDDDLSALTIADAQALLAQGNGFALLRGAPGFSHIEGRDFVTPLDKVHRRAITVRTCLIDRTGPRARVTNIKTACCLADQQVGPLLAYHRMLIDRYADIAHLRLTGAIRM